MYLSRLLNELNLIPAGAWDCHLHGWIASKTSWIRGSGLPLEQDFDPARLQPMLQEIGIESAVIIQALDFADEGDSEADRLIEWVQENSFLSSAVVSANLESGAEIESRLAYLARTGQISGIRIIKPQEVGCGIFESPNFIAAANLLPKYGLHLEWLMREQNSGQFEETARAFEKLDPDLLIMGNHLLKPIDIGHGRPTKRWMDAIRTLSNRKNFWMKLSALGGEAPPGTPAEKFFPYYEHVLESFGTDRLVFGSDFPVSALRGTYADAMALHLNWVVGCGHHELTRTIFCDNPKRFYGRSRVQ